MRRNIYLLLAFLGFAILISSPIGAAQESADGKRLVVPRDLIACSVLSQDGCPLTIEDALLVYSPGGGRDYLIRVTNRSNKIVVRYDVAIIGVDGSSEVVAFDLDEGDHLSPNASNPETRAELLKGVTFVTASEIRKMRKWPGEGLAAIEILLVRRVVFADGSRYDDQENCSRLAHFLQQESSGGLRD